MCVFGAQCAADENRLTSHGLCTQHTHTHGHLLDRRYFGGKTGRQLRDFTMERRRALVRSRYDVLTASAQYIHTVYCTCSDHYMFVASYVEHIGGCPRIFRFMVVRRL